MCDDKKLTNMRKLCPQSIAFRQMSSRKKITFFIQRFFLTFS